MTGKFFFLRLFRIPMSTAHGKCVEGASSNRRGARTRTLIAGMGMMNTNPPRAMRPTRGPNTAPFCCAPSPVTTRTRMVTCPVSPRTPSPPPRDKYTSDEDDEEEEDDEETQAEVKRVRL